jgi:hypothetical protein
MDETYLERVLAREALIAVIAGKRLDSKMDPLMPLQIVVSVEALRTLIALERPVIGSRLLVLWMAHEMRHCCCVTAVETGHHRWVSSDEGESTAGVLDIGEDGGLAARVLQGWSLLVLVG